MGEDAYKETGEIDPFTQFVVNTPFYFRSTLPMQRVAECVGANNIVLKKWAKGRKAQ
jgi:hypothetical protein